MEEEQNLVFRRNNNFNDNYEYYLNNNNNSNNNNNNNYSNIECIVMLLIILFFTFCITLYDVYHIFNLLKNTKNAYYSLPEEIFEKCHYYQNFSEIFITTVSFFTGINICIFSILILGEFLERFSKLQEIFYYYNFLFFGPYLTSAVVLTFKISGKVIYTCVNNNTQLKRTNLGLMFFVFFTLSFSIFIFFVGDFYFIYYYMEESFKLNFYGNYYLGKAFWYIALKHSSTFHSRRNNNNNGNNINENRQNAQNERNFFNIRNNEVQDNENVDNFLLYI